MKRLLLNGGSIFGALAALIKSDFAHAGYAPAPRVGPKVEKGTGAERARKRHAAKLKANQLIPSGDRMTRQRYRALKRTAAKESRITPAEFGRRKMAILNSGKPA